MINVTQAYLPEKEKFKAYVDRIYESGWLTNNGAIVRELEKRLQEYLGVKHLILVANGSLALQLSYKALGLKGDVITSPFSFVATASTLVWEGLNPVFSDIDPDTFNVSPDEIEKNITDKTTAIVPVHVFGNPCEVELIHGIADKNNLKVIYDAAHAFGVNYKGESILNYGDVSTLSFHATKLFHTIEGGAVITNDDSLAEKIRLLINFGISDAKINTLGINAKMNEFEAAMGMCVLDEINNIKKQREKIWKTYLLELKGLVNFQMFNKNSNNNYSYAPVLFDSKQQVLKVERSLNEHHIYPRRYFYPSLDTLDFLSSQPLCSISKNIADRTLCLPIFSGLNERSQLNILTKIKEAICVN